MLQITVFKRQPSTHTVHINALLYLTHTVDPLPMRSSPLLFDTGQLQHGGATAFLKGTLTDFHITRLCPAHRHVVFPASRRSPQFEKKKKKKGAISLNSPPVGGQHITTVTATCCKWSGPGARDQVVSVLRC